MSDENKNVPKIRFPGFTTDWEQRELGSFSKKVMEKNKENEYSETLTNSAEFGIINQRDFFDKDISNERNLNGYYVVRPDDFVYNPRISNFAPVGPIKRNKLGRTGVMSPLYYVFRIHDVDNTYLEKYFSSDRWHKFMKMNGDSGARSDRFAIKDAVFREMLIPIPSVEEQVKIGNIFNQLDNLITLHQRKLDHLQEKKKSLLQKMFPKSGEDVPEIRFPGFKDAWEQRKVGGLGNIVTGSTPQTSDRTNFGGNYLFVSPGDIKGGRYINDTVTKLSEKGFKKGRILKGGSTLFVSIGSTIGKVAQIKEIATTNQQINSIEPTEEYDKDFIYSLMEYKASKIKLFAATQAVPIINKTTFSKVDVIVPLSLEEQAKIGNFFERLDNTITLHQRKLNHLQEQKKSLLQQMFV